MGVVFDADERSLGRVGRRDRRVCGGRRERPRTSAAGRL